MSYNDLKNIQSMLTAVSDSEKLPLISLLSKAKKALALNPEDVTIGQVKLALDKLSGDKLFITRADFKSLYRHFYTRNNQLANIFAEELGAGPKASSVTYAAPTAGGSVKQSVEFCTDSVLDSALESCFDKNQPLKNYSKISAAEAVRRVSSELTQMGLTSSVEVVSGAGNFIIVQAAIETPKGRTNVYIPAETIGESVLPLSMLFSNNGVEDFNKKNVISYVQHSAGVKLKVTPAQITDLLRRVATGESAVSSVELAVTRLNSTKEQSGDLMGAQILGQILDTAPVQDVSMPQFRDSEIESFADRFDSPQGRAACQFGERKIINARNMLISEFKSLGYGPPQVSVQDSNKDSVLFAIAVGNTAITVPFKMAGNETPNVFIVNGSVRELSRDNIDKLMREESKDYKAAAATSALYGVKPSELIESVRTAMSQNNLVMAEDALNCLAQQGDRKAYDTGMGIYMELIGKEAMKEEKSRCTRITRSAHSKFDICGHTGLPVHEVYQDSVGDCVKNYRKAMSETYEGAAFMTNKVFL